MRVTGTVWVNDYHLLSVAAPFGGYKQSGIGRQFGVQGFELYTEIKVLAAPSGKRATSLAWGEVEKAEALAEGGT